MTLQQFLLILWARRKLIAAIFLGTVLTSLIVSLLLPKQYTGRATVLIDVKSPDPIAGIILPGLMTPGYMATQVDIINSDRVARRVVKMLRMDQSPAIQEQWRDDTEGKGDVVTWLAPLLQKKLDVKPSRESNVLEINFNGPDPEFAAAVANAFAQGYIETNIDLRVEPAKQYSAWFEQQLKVQRDQLEVAQKKLSEYQQSSGIVVTDERLDSETQKLNELTAQLAMAEAQGADSSSKQRMGASDTVRDVIENPVINGLKVDVARAESKLKEMAGNLGENHPQYQRSQAELAELKERLKAETNKITASIATAARVSDAKEADIQRSIEAQKKKVLDLRKQRDEISVLLRDVDTAQKAFDNVAQRMSQSNLEAQSIQTNIALLTPAVAPLEPSKPRLFLNLLVSIFMGGMLSVGSALMMEITRRRIHSTEDIIQELDLPVLAEIESADSMGGNGWKFWKKSRNAARSLQSEPGIGQG